MADYIVGRIAGNVMIDPDAGGHQQQRNRERSARKKEIADTVQISEEARKRSADGDDGAMPEDPPAL